LTKRNLQGPCRFSCFLGRAVNIRRTGSQWRSVLPGTGLRSR
jgi:hypothetical protein